MHDEEASGHLSPRVCSLAVRHGRLTHAAMKQGAERAETLKTDFEAHISYTQFIAAKQLLRFFNATLDQVLMRCFVKGFPEQSEEVIT